MRSCNHISPKQDIPPGVTPISDHEISNKLIVLSWNKLFFCQLILE